MWSLPDFWDMPAWDVYRHRVNKVVVRSMAEYCGVLDTLLALAIVIAAVRE